MSITDKYNPIVFYDGECGFCNSTVQFILKRRRKDFYFMALQTEQAKDILGKYDIEINMDTIYFMKDGKVYNKSSAALQIARGLKGLYPLLYVFYIVPKFIRDAIYTAIAKRRHRIMSDYCPVPDQKNAKFMLDD